jgi:glycosyltransferase involved in cell wall biosynthesis
MRILMLGWEFPPFIAGGLGTACYGLTRALARAGHEVLFVLPRSIDRSLSSHVSLLTPDELPQVHEEDLHEPESVPTAAIETEDTITSSQVTIERRRKSIEVLPVNAGFDSPYPEFAGGSTLALDQLIRQIREERRGRTFKVGSIELPTDSASAAMLREAYRRKDELSAAEGHYGSDLMGDAQRYAFLCVALAAARHFDVIHAHDWLTYPAGVAVRAMSGKPLVVHVHATEFDRSGDCVNQQVYDIERAGMAAADRVIAVSQLTRNILVRRYGVTGDKIDVVYNGVDQDSVQPTTGATIERDDKIVLFLGRITMQKGPEYFIRAAKRVLEKVPNAKFVVAGSGDMALRMINHAAELGIGQKVLFTGFLRGRDVKRIFDIASCYVMPSVSEPFGIAALEAMHHDTPVIISKQSGVSEVLSHALKVDFWDVDEMANKIVAVLRYAPLSATLREHGALELRGLNWDGAAEKCIKSYARAISASRH